MRIDQLDTFNPMTVPTLDKLMIQLNQAMPMEEDSENIENEASKKEWFYTDLKPYIETFESFVKNMEDERRVELMKHRAEEEKKLLF